MSKIIYPCLWLDDQARPAADFYCSLFADSHITKESSVVVEFELTGFKIIGLNGGPNFSINPSISLFVSCADDAEINRLSESLGEGGSFMMPLDKYPWSEKYAWVKDKFGMTWQLMREEVPKGRSKIIPSLLFSNKQYGKATEALKLYTSLLPNSQLHHMEFYGENEVQQEGNLKFGHFTLNGQLFAAMDGPGDDKLAFNEGVSFVVECNNQEEIDHYWNSLTANGGEESMCGWLKDKFGVSWQIIPTVLGKLMSDPKRGPDVMNALLKMRKLDIAKLENAGN
ncbi:MAG: VOC family protein [Saprospiraceae bacterium]|nr:VOC family protein [Saprospiraceae bacterium]